MNKSYKYYSQKGYKKVFGWLLDGAVQIINHLGVIQQELNVRGSIGEIGVQHGKLFILLHLLTKGNEKGLALDLFDLQDENIDRSGRGDKEIFISNLKKFGCQISNIEVVTANSLDVSSEEMLHYLEQKAKFFSIDGGHTPEITLNDLEKVVPLMCEGGIVIIDDYFNSLWPGVSEGVWRYLMKYPNSIFPVAIGGNKIFFTNNRDYAKKYLDYLVESNIADYILTKFKGEDVVTFRFLGKYGNMLGKTKFWRRIKDTRFGETIKNIYRKFG